MKKVPIKDIDENIFKDLKVNLPTLPAGLSSFKVKNEDELLTWKLEFINLYGSEGELYLEFYHSGQVQKNEKFKEACIATAKGVLRK